MVMTVFDSKSTASSELPIETLGPGLQSLPHAERCCTRTLILTHRPAVNAECCFGTWLQSFPVFRIREALKLLLLVGEFQIALSILNTPAFSTAIHLGSSPAYFVQEVCFSSTEEQETAWSYSTPQLQVKC
jgi:hypothetical protein